MMNDRDVIDAFVAYLREHGHPGLQVERRPDEENRSSSDIDAIAGPFAIEHTSVDTLPDQRRHDDHFMQAVGVLERGLGCRPPFRLSIAIDYTAVAVGQAWDAIQDALRMWIINEAPGLPNGRSIVERVPGGVPFRLDVEKTSEGRPGIFFSRFRPADDTLPARIKAVLERKAMKLAKYQAQGFTTILLVESGDIALMNRWKMIDAIREAFLGALPEGVHQVWYADASIKRALEFWEITADLCGQRSAEDEDDW
jgi:hypothetical protein